MSTIAAAAQTPDRIDYWIRRHLIQYCYGTHPSQSQSKFNPSRDRRVGLSAIGQCLKDQYDALASPMVIEPMSPSYIHDAPPCSSIHMSDLNRSGSPRSAGDRNRHD